MDDCEQFDSPDGDSCNKEEISRLFSERYIRVDSANILKHNPTLNLTGILAESSGDLIALVRTDKQVLVVNRNVLKTTQSYCPHEKNITSLKFVGNDSIYTSCIDGTIKVYDNRSNKIEKVIDLKGEATVTCPITSFDVSANGRILCAGTELVDQDSFLLFWDMRGDKLLGGYSECHSDDISCVNFCPDNSDIVASAATDGLMNVFDISQPNEDDALTYSLNTEDTVNFLYWSSARKKTILALTDVDSIQYWDIEEAQPKHIFRRDNIAKSLKRKLSYECYVVPIVSASISDDPLILGASGLEHLQTSCLRTMKLNSKRGVLEPHGILVQEKDYLNSIVSGALYNEEEDSFLTVAESGFLTFWRNKEQSKHSSKSERRKSGTKKKPYHR